MVRHSRHVAHELHVYLHDQAHWKTIARWLVIGGAILLLVVWFGRDVVDLYFSYTANHVTKVAGKAIAEAESDMP